ncbi:hypothetical protein SIN8267_02523 [Sinobacterium norvegicum]|uniref:Uncharacterized protein n=1 Tax=Sinobacterium norvegicum TaxID=1641715 RepID=A0ABM9AGR1_9GAMM|nr:hypothetical protein [Sinobacterium norvegicum]CAH0992403.1 hypothetical protein SIN8267_02523 [Sinobacterium norvegicum]
MHSKEVLELFVVKAEKLIASSLSKKMQKEHKVTIGSEIIDYIGPTEEELDAFLLTHRLFFQKNENFRVNNLHSHFKKFGADETKLENLIEIQAWIKKYWNSDSSLIYNGEIMSNWDIYQGFLYGDLAHTNNPENRKKFIAWNKSTISKELSYFDFRDILGKTLMVIAQLKYLTESVLSK